MIEYELVTNPERLGHIANELVQAPAVALDIETTSLSPHHGQIRLVQLNTGKGIYVIDLFQTGTLGPVCDALSNEGVVKVIQNAKFEQKWFLHKFGLELWPLFDTFRASAMYHNGKNLGHNLYDLYRRELKISPEVPDAGESNWKGPLTEEQLRYAAEDVMHLLVLRDRLKEKLAKAGLLRAALIEFGAIIGEASIELNGFRLDKTRWMRLVEQNREKHIELRKKLDYELPHPKGMLSLPGISAGFNYNSPVQVKAAFARLGIELEDTREDTFAMIAHKHPAIPTFMAYRKVSKKLSAFGEQFLEHIDKSTGRVHTDFWPLTGAGRYSSSKPNLQQIPRGNDYRDCFWAGPGRKIVVVDFSQVELRITAEISGDSLFRSIYLNGEDAHRRTASIVSGVPIEEVTKQQRQAAKPVNFGLIYGLGAERLVIYSQSNYGVSITLGQAKKFIKRYFEGYAGVKAWHDRALRDFRRNPCVRTLSGRLRYLDPEKAHGEIFNTPVQGTGADGLKAALRNTYYALKKYNGAAKMVHMVHDEIVTDTEDDPELVAAVAEDVKGAMVNGIQPLIKSVPILAEPDIGTSWAAH